MPLQALTLHRCASCQRWSGVRHPGPTPQSVEIDSELTLGTCLEGPWNGTERRARSACGQWTAMNFLANGGRLIDDQAL
jgi:hypothetical protein